MGTLILVILIIIELCFFIWGVITKKNHKTEKSMVRMGEFLLLIFLLITKVLDCGFRYYGILVLLIIQATFGAYHLWKKRREVKSYKMGKSIVLLLGNSFLFTMALSIAILFPQYKLPKVTGDYEVATKADMWVDKNRIEEFDKSGNNRSLGVQFWYPKDGEGTYPLVVFSHGAFGLKSSNESTYIELASNGYVVCSIDHTYHAIMSKNASGKMIMADRKFVQQIYDINAGVYTSEEQLAIENKWMKLRVDDENYVLNTIINNVKKNPRDELYSKIDIEYIGLIGHSMGGASSAKLGRDRDDIDAVVDLDGTMFGEEIGLDGDYPILIDEPYPVPLLNLYTDSHYNEAKKLEKELAPYEYDNFYASKNAKVAYEVIFNNAGHLNFTDLPLFSPILAKFLGIGKIDKYYCIENMNDIVLQFFDCYLKGGKEPTFKKEY